MSGPGYAPLPGLPQRASLKALAGVLAEMPTFAPELPPAEAPMPEAFPEVSAEVEALIPPRTSWQTSSEAPSCQSEGMSEVVLGTQPVAAQAESGKISGRAGIRACGTAVEKIPDGEAQAGGGVQKERFMLAWPVVASWIAANLDAAVRARHLFHLSQAYWHAWVEGAAIFLPPLPPLVSSSESDTSSDEEAASGDERSASSLEGVAPSEGDDIIPVGDDTADEWFEWSTSEVKEREEGEPGPLELHEGAHARECALGKLGFPDPGHWSAKLQVKNSSVQNWPSPQVALLEEVKLPSETGTSLAEATTTQSTMTRCVSCQLTLRRISQESIGP